jgi:hypothetical protein
MAALCRRLCGETRFCFKEGIRSPAIATYLPIRYWTASTLSRPPWMFGKSAWAPRRPGSRSHSFSVVMAVVVSGVHRAVRNSRPCTPHAGKTVG